MKMKRERSSIERFTSDEVLERWVRKAANYLGCSQTKPTPENVALVVARHVPESALAVEQFLEKLAKKSPKVFAEIGIIVKCKHDTDAGDADESTAKAVYAIVRRALAEAGVKDLSEVETLELV